MSKTDRWEVWVGEAFYGSYQYVVLASDYDRDTQALRAERDAALAELAALKGGRAATGDIFWREKLAIKFCEARGILDGSKERASVVDAFVSALSFAAPPAQASAWVPEGWKLVPVEPTQEMLAAMHAVTEKPYNHANKSQMYQAKHAYKAMLSAAGDPDE